MHLDYMKIFHFLFPLSEDELRMKNMTKENFLTLLSVRRTNSVTTLLPYSDNRIRSAIHLLKFHNHQIAKTFLAEVLSQYLNTSLPEGREHLLIPIPLSSSRLRTRGYNQVSEVLQQALTLGTRGTLANNILRRTRNTTPQTRLNREKRLQNLRGAFAIIHKDPAFLAGKHIILIDDVTTTGTTLAEAKATLLPLSPASITCIALAH